MRGDLLEDIKGPSIGLIVLGVAAMIFQLIGVSPSSSLVYHLPRTFKSHDYVYRSCDYTYYV